MVRGKGTNKLRLHKYGVIEYEFLGRLGKVIRGGGHKYRYI